MREPVAAEFIPEHGTPAPIAYQIVKDETFPQTQPRLNLATFVTTYMDDYGTRLMNDAVGVNYIDETEYPRVAVMCGRCINMVANMWHTPEKGDWKTGAVGIGSSEACMLGGVAAWLRWRERRKAAGKPYDKPNLVMSTAYQVVWEKFCQLWQIEMRTVPITHKHPTLDIEQALRLCDENTICIVPIAGVTWTGMNDDIEALDFALDGYNAKTGHNIPIHVDAASGGFILPFLDPEKKWDFRLKWVLSISTSGHKYGLVYPGLGWVVWKDKQYLPKEMNFSVNYLGANITQVGLNFSRPAAQILGQYYNFLHLGVEGYREIHSNSMAIAKYCHEAIGQIPCFQNYAGNAVHQQSQHVRIGNDVGVVADGGGLNILPVSRQLAFQQGAEIVAHLHLSANVALLPAFVNGAGVGVDGGNDDLHGVQTQVVAGKTLPDGFLQHIADANQVG